MCVLCRKSCSCVVDMFVLSLMVSEVLHMFALFLAPVFLILLVSHCVCDEVCRCGCVRSCLWQLLR